MFADTKLNDTVTQQKEGMPFWKDLDRVEILEYSNTWRELLGKKNTSFTHGRKWQDKGVWP